jgi:hypothetical protein
VETPRLTPVAGEANKASVVKVDRIPRWQLRRMSAAQREAYNDLRWSPCASAERARLKKTLDWKRTREETIALALELQGEGRGNLAIADELEVSDRYLVRLLDQVRDTEKQPRNRSSHATEMAPTCETSRAVPPGVAVRQMYAGDAFSYDLRSALERTVTA